MTRSCSYISFASTRGPVTLTLDFLIDEQQQERRPLKVPHVFVSYVREDSKPVEELCNALRQNGIRTWIDRNDILPGTRWKASIRSAINEGDYFIACFSSNYIRRTITYMNEELTLAIEILRQKPIERAWFIPVLLSECDVPDRDIGAGETLSDLQQVHLYEDWTRGLNQILSVIKAGLPSPEADMSDKAAEPERISVLFLAADPNDTKRLRLDNEVREIQSKLLQSRHRDRFHMEMRVAVRPTDLMEALLLVKPQIVHFIGHGIKSKSLVLEDDSGRRRPVSASSLTSMFKVVADNVECVVLNVGYSSELARVLAKEIDYVVGMSSNMSDTAAISFASGFYQAIGYGRPIEEAFKLGCMQLKLEGSPEQDIPVLAMKG